MVNDSCCKATVSSRDIGCLATKYLKRLTTQNCQHITSDYVISTQDSHHINLTCTVNSKVQDSQPCNFSAVYQLQGDQSPVLTKFPDFFTYFSQRHFIFIKSPEV